jgi:ribonuclease Z
VGTLVLTHFSARYDDVTGLTAQAGSRATNAKVIAAQDLQRIAFPKRRPHVNPDSPGGKADDCQTQP